MADSKYVRFLESIYSRVDQQVRDILATLPTASIAAQSEGDVITNQHRILNFQGDGVSVTDEPGMRRTNVFIPGAPAAVTTTTFVSAAGNERVFAYGTAPANWQTNAFVDSGWALSVLQNTPPTGFYVVAPGSAWIVVSSLNGNQGASSVQFLSRRTFTVPAGTIASATLEINLDDTPGAFAGGGGDEIYINGHKLTPFSRSGFPVSFATFDIPITWLNAGASNVLAVNTFSSGGEVALSYRVTINQNAVGADPQYQLLSEKDQPLGYPSLDSGGKVPTSELPLTTGTIVVQEVDGTPTVGATELVLPNGTLSVVGTVATYTPAGGVGNATTTGAGGSEPGSPSTGDLYLPTSGQPALERYSGSAWSQWGPFVPLTKPPLVTNWTWVNQGSSTATDDAGGGIFLSTPGNAGFSISALVRTAPSTPYVLTAAFTFHHLATNSQGAGLVLRDSSGARAIFFSVGTSSGNPALVVSQCTNVTTFSTNSFSATGSAFFLMLGGMIFLRISDNGTTRTYEISPDLQHWMTVLSETHTTWLTANQVGIGVNSNGSSRVTAMNLLHWTGA